MTEMHTKEPWTIQHEFNAFGPNDRLACNTGGHSDNTIEDGGHSENAANARRIVACVNACAGIPTEALEAGAVAHALCSLKVLRDESVAYRTTHDHKGDDHVATGRAWDLVGRAIADANAALSKFHHNPKEPTC